ncbi:MAG: MBOAT family protein [Leptolyngbya sp. SIO3F4]|nr:MBOAT family protein [Leptolyngbya sp. SIO3F4]
MFFNSIDYLVFFPVVVTLFFALPHRFRWILLLASSYFFYMWWKTEYILLIASSTLVDYFASRKMGKLESKAKRWPYLMLSIALNLGILLLFKYFNFFNENARQLAEWLNITYAIPAFEALLPMGISFYTLQTMSYSIDVYKGRIQPERHLGIFALFVSFFPQLVAGPIERARTLLPQFRKRMTFDYERVTEGLKLIGWGLFKKIAIADQIAPMVNEVFDNHTEYNGFSLVLTSYLFAFQVYCDFAGYSDIGIGSAKVLGFKLMDNFRRPFLARSMSEFWGRWHISLTSWFRDYLFMPLMRLKSRKVRWQTGILLIYLVSGLWHGANWTFLAWGLMHAGIIIVSRMTPKTKAAIHRLSGLARFPKLDYWVDVWITITLFASSTAFFRAIDIHQSIDICIQLVQGWGSDMRSILFNSGPGREHVLFLGQSFAYFLNTWLFIALLMGLEVLEEKRGSLIKLVGKQPVLLRWTIYLTCVFCIILYSAEKEVPFIYFQF